MPCLSNDHFDLHRARQVPDAYSWPFSYLQDHPTSSSSAAGADTNSIPIIDISRPDAASLIGAACRSWGVFYATAHGVPARLLRDIESQARRLFSLPLHRKLLAARRPGSVSGYGRPPLSSFFPSLMWSEGFTLAADFLHAAIKIWPHDHSLFCDVTDEYRENMKELAGKLLSLMFLSLGVDEEDTGRVTLGLPQAVDVLQLNSYPACPEPDKAMGMAAHTDSGLLTVLQQSSGAAGLQVLRTEDGPARWVPVTPLTGALVVHVGDLLHILSNGQFRSVRHRAVVRRAEHRFSAAYIIGPPGHVNVGPISTLVDPTQGPAYRPVTWPEYLGIRARLFDEALDSVKIFPDRS